ncbi:hypothetical protein BpHYR1_048619 [Brachionus plicatilis]|uniref:Uncharacterized protein n=1 Tax=Brachionus plicatilis TaxID=10195 RepID=A0A3M7RM51_BRAPC|nr:hypothetical protein BpHYR1_048619 [Brachionus plicatilis]
MLFYKIMIFFAFKSDKKIKEVSVKLNNLIFYYFQVKCYFCLLNRQIGRLILAAFGPARPARRPILSPIKLELSFEFIEKGRFEKEYEKWQNFLNILGPNPNS